MGRIITYTLISLCEDDININDDKPVLLSVLIRHDRANQYFFRKQAY